MYELEEVVKDDFAVCRMDVTAAVIDMNEKGIAPRQNHATLACAVLKLAKVNEGDAAAGHVKRATRNEEFVIAAVDLTNTLLADDPIGSVMFRNAMDEVAPVTQQIYREKKASRQMPSPAVLVAG